MFLFWCKLRTYISVIEIYYLFVAYVRIILHIYVKLYFGIWSLKEKFNEQSPPLLPSWVLRSQAAQDKIIISTRPSSGRKNFLKIFVLGHDPYHA